MREGKSILSFGVKLSTRAQDVKCAKTSSRRSKSLRELARAKTTRSRDMMPQTPLSSNLKSTHRVTGMPQVQKEKTR